jgi:hypothetical protein
MPDITMCSGDGCHRRERCYRATATPNARQSYFASPPLKQVWVGPVLSWDCSHFAPTA